VRLAEVDQLVRRHRALLAGLLTAGAVATALPVLAPDPPSSVRVLAAARDLSPGTPLTDDDLTTVAVPTSLAPESVLSDPAAAVGRAVSGSVRRGELLTDARLLGAGLLQGRGLVAAPVRLADVETLALLHAGDHVDVLATPTSSDGPVASAATVASNVQVLAVPAVQDGADGGLVVLAATPATAARLAAAAVGARLSVTVLPAG
jgi:Flp pilus assembly protein CpaB